MDDMWGWCGPCRRWFAVERLDFDTLRLCPVCLSVAEVLEQRAG